jgi:hypothetical protein
MADSAVVDSALVDAPYANPALYKIDVPALSYIYAAYGKSSLISNESSTSMEMISVIITKNY